MSRVEFIAFYLPQFHQIEENDRFWGAGFTDWHMVKKAAALFPGHSQPRIPELGYYDLLDQDVRKTQAELASTHGISAFCYWHYYFGNGQVVMDKPLQKMLDDGEPDLPFMLGWVNQDWRANWSGRKGELLLKQEYPGLDDAKAHLELLLPFFRHPNYLKHDGKLIYLIYNPGNIPYLVEMKQHWSVRVKEETGLDLHFLGYQNFNTSRHFGNTITSWLYWDYLFNRLDIILRFKLFNRFSIPYPVSYRKIANRFREGLNLHKLPVVYSDWDNTPRMRRNSFIFTHFNADSFGEMLLQAGLKIRHSEFPFVFIKSWNEWAEGNVLEPDTQRGTELLQTVSRVRKRLDEE